MQGKELAKFAFSGEGMLAGFQERPGMSRPEAGPDPFLGAWVLTSRSSSVCLPESPKTGPQARQGP